MSLSLCRASVLWFICRVPIAQNTIRICPNIASSGTPLHRGKSQPFSYPLSSLLYDTFLKFPLSSSPPSFHTYFFSIFLFFFTNPYFLVFSSLTLSLIFFRYIRYIFYPFSPIRPKKKPFYVYCLPSSSEFRSNYTAVLFYSFVLRTERIFHVEWQSLIILPSCQNHSIFIFLIDYHFCLSPTTYSFSLSSSPV